MAEFGFPPTFPVEQSEEPEQVDAPDPADPTKRAKKVKSKVAAKTGGVTYQWEIMKGLGMDNEQIKGSVCVC